LVAFRIPGCLLRYTLRERKEKGADLYSAAALSDENIVASSDMYWESKELRQPFMCKMHIPLTQDWRHCLDVLKKLKDVAGASETHIHAPID
jgi:hypothetical protein